ncbi:hypothetical protein QFC19_004095 [Naganishia cerealis]|uniref:Uncharacterized protein n=1 Tax=Naganishia cerealis TaxID=610337 RepID=A0ACC2VZQ9_9TREE|nr:hypothetical protein QFC19_004095 [Naganishia cerealis]
MSSLRTRRASEFPKPATFARNNNLGAVSEEVPEIPVHHVPSGANPLLLSSVGSSKPSGPQRAPTYVRRADVQAQQHKGKDGDKDKRRMSRVGEKIKKGLSMRYQDSSLAVDTPPVPSDSYSTFTTPQNTALPQFGIGQVIPTMTYTSSSLDKSQAYPSDPTDALNNKFSSYSLAPGTAADGRKGSSAYARRTSRFDGPGVSTGMGMTVGSSAAGAVGGGGFGRIVEEEEEEGEGAVMHDIGERQRWDLEALKNSNVDLNIYIKDTLAGAEEDELNEFKQALQKRKAENAEELKRNVLQHYGEFVAISKEVSTLENEMLELKDLVAEWKTVPELLNNGVDPTMDLGPSTAGGLSSLERRKTVRNSILDLQNMYRAQLQSLWTQVSGSQKYLPITPGRHLVCEASNFIELNPATYKTKQLVELFLLNDLMLVAVRKRKRSTTETHAGTERRGAAGADSSAKGQLMAEKCFTLSEITVSDIKDSGVAAAFATDLTNAIKVKRAKETYVYRTNHAEDKRALLMAFRQVNEELQAKKREQNEREQERRKSMWTGELTMAKGQSAVPRVPRIPAALAAADGMPTDSSSINSFEDDLAMVIALRDWAQSVELVLKARGYLSSALAKSLPDPSIAARLASLTRELVSQITDDLSDPDIRKSEVIDLTAFLTRLDEGQAARDAFLRARKELLGKRTRMIGYHGDVPTYISELAIVTFTILKHTSDWYLAAFQDNNMVSGKTFLLD